MEISYRGVHASGFFLVIDNPIKNDDVEQELG